MLLVWSMSGKTENKIVAPMYSGRSKILMSEKEQNKPVKATPPAM
jgi:hypothetical protein